MDRHRVFNRSTESALKHYSMRLLTMTVTMNKNFFVKSNSTMPSTLSLKCCYSIIFSNSYKDTINKNSPATVLHFSTYCHFPFQFSIRPEYVRLGIWIYLSILVISLDRSQEDQFALGPVVPIPLNRRYFNCVLP